MTQLQLIETIQASYMSEISAIKDWAHHADKAVIELAGTGKTFTTDDVRRLMPEGLAPAHPNAWGGLLSAWRTRGLIKAVGYATTTRASRHGAPQRLWTGTTPTQRKQAA